MAKYTHWAVVSETWNGRAACGVRVDPENTAVIFMDCPRCLKKFRAAAPHAFAPGDKYPSIAPLRNPRNNPE